MVQAKHGGHRCLLRHHRRRDARGVRRASTIHDSGRGRAHQSRLARTRMAVGAARRTSAYGRRCRPKRRRLKLDGLILGDGEPGAAAVAGLRFDPRTPTIRPASTARSMRPSRRTRPVTWPVTRRSRIAADPSGRAGMSRPTVGSANETAVPCWPTSGAAGCGARRTAGAAPARRRSRGPRRAAPPARAPCRSSRRPSCRTRGPPLASGARNRACGTRHRTPAR